MARLAHSCAALLLSLTSGFAADPDPRSPPDVFGRPRPHGEPVEKGFVGLYAGRTTLAFGQPMRADLFAVAASERNGPYVNPSLTHAPNAKLELTDAAGKPVPFRLEDGGYNGGNGLEQCSFTLWPTKEHAAGVCWKPGQYTLKATVTNPNEPAAPNKLPGQFKSNKLEFTVREFGAALDTWDGKGKLRQSTHNATEADDVCLFVAGLDDASVERLMKDGVGPFVLVPNGPAVARFAAVTVPQDRKLTAAEVKKLLTDLADDNPATRIQAVRSVPPTAPPEVFVAAVAILADPYSELSRGNKIFSTHPLRGFAADALGRLGTGVIGPLLAFAEQKEHAAHRPQVARILGRIGPTESAEKFLRAAIYSPDRDLSAAAQEAASTWGKHGVPLFRELLTVAKLPKEAAIKALGRSGDLKTDGPALRVFLAATDWGEIQAAVEALTALRDTEPLSEFERIARDRGIDQNARYPAVNAVLALGDAKTADRLLLDLIQRKGDRLRGFALQSAGMRRLNDALPVALDALDDTDWFTRVMADYALRGLAGDRAGVGYDPGKPDAKLWRDFWARKEKK